MENIKIFDANLRQIGTMERKDAHKEGKWHVTFHCWVVNPANNSILFQLRSKEKQNYPDMFDVSAAGHLLDTEEVEDGIREVSEELGINLDQRALYSLGYRVEVDDQDNGQKNREYQAVYLAKVCDELSLYKPQIDEVSGLMWMGIDDALALFSNQKNSVQMQGIVYDAVHRNWQNKKREVRMTDFIPRIQQYYLTIAIMSERSIEGKYPLAIS